MKKHLLLYYLLLIITGLSFGQTFSSTSSGAISGTFADLTNTISVSNLGNLDGINLGITSVEINIKSLVNNTKIDMYLVAPNGHAVFIMGIMGTNGSFVTNTYSFNFIANWTTKFTDWTGQATGTFNPYGNFNSFNIGANPNGVWKLHAKMSGAANVTSWKITFGSADLIVGSPNQTRNTAIDLINTTQTANFIRGNTNFNGTFLTETKGSMVGSGSPYTETNAWFKFVPKCKNDKIEVSSLNWLNEIGGGNYIQAGVLSVGASSVPSPLTNGTSTSIKDAPYTFPITTFIPGNTYYLLLDGDNGSFINYRVKWFEGTLGCLVNSITTSATPKTTFCLNETFSIPFTSTGTFTAGNKFTAELSDASGSFTNPIIIGSLDAVSATSVPVTLPSTLASGTGYKIRVNGSAPATTGSPSSTFKIINIPATPISFTGSPSVCANATNQVYSVGLVTDATFYKWRTTSASIVSINAADSSSVNVNFGTLNNTFSVQAVNACGASAPLQKTIVVNPIQTPSVSILANKSAICQGDSVTFTAIPALGGTNPVFQWKINQTNAGINSNVFKTVSLKKSDSVFVEMKSNVACASPSTVSSNKIGIVVNDTIKPEIAISGSIEFCQGSTAKYTASTKNKGTSPVFEWRVNKILQSATDSVFSSSTLNDKDTIRVQLKSSAVCAKPSIVKAALYPLKVVNSILPTVSIKGTSSVCEGTNLSFTTETTGGGASPSFVWKVNNQTKGTGPTFSSNTLLNADVLTVEMASDDACANPKQVDSNPITIQQKRTPTISLQTLKVGICQGDSFTFKASSTFAGTYAWKVNKNLMNNISNSFGSISLKTGDSVKVEFTSTETCLTNPKVSDFKVVLVNDTIISEISISGDLSICEGKMARYIATTKNGGAQPIFKWFRNNASQSSSDSVFSTILNDKDSVWAVLESSARCIRQAQVNSKKIGVSVVKSIVPSISISTKAISCLGENITINSVVQSAGNNPSYTWYLNDVVQSNTAPSYSGSTFVNGDKIKVELQSTERCANPSKVPSNVLVLDRKIYVAPSLSINGDTIGCKKQAIPIFLNSTENWTPPTLLWKVDGRIIPKIASAYYPENLAVGKHTIEVSLTSTDVCTNEYTLSKTRTISVLDSIYPTINITGDTVLCKGSDAFFRLLKNPTLKNQSYKWLVDGIELGNESTFQSFNLIDGSEVVLEMKATEMCLSPNAIVSNRLKVKVLESILPEIILNVSKTEICPSEEITVSSQIINGNALQEFQWLKNGDSLVNETGEEFIIKIQRDDVLSFLYKTELTCGAFAKTFTAPNVFVKDPPPALTFIKSPNDYCAQDAEIVFKTDLLTNVTYTWEYPTYAKASIEGNVIRLNLEGNITKDTLKVTASNECGKGNAIGVLLKPKNCPKLFIPNAINLSETDGNELWHIQGIELYPKAKVDVFNRWGTNVFHSKGYIKPFDGTFNGKALPTGTYYYVIEFVNESPIVGDLTILH